MQLLIILALLLYGGKSNPQNLLSEVKPVLETFGGEEIKEALKSAEELSEMISAVRDLAAPLAAISSAQNSPNTASTAHSTGATVKNTPANGDVSFPLAPISNVANREITYSLSKYFS